MLMSIYIFGLIRFSFAVMWGAQR